MDKNYKDPNCAYCAKGDLVNVFGYEVCELPASVLYVFRDQTIPAAALSPQNSTYRKCVN